MSQWMKSKVVVGVVLFFSSVRLLLNSSQMSNFFVVEYVIASSHAHPYVNSCLCSHQNNRFICKWYFSLLHIPFIYYRSHSVAHCHNRRFFSYVCMHFTQCFCTIFFFFSFYFHRFTVPIRFEKPFTRPLIKIHIEHVNEGDPPKSEPKNIQHPEQDNTKQ